ncbi:purine-cytosine permease family protein [Syntrophaceticus schinkii]|uniref:Permease for cytosine/purines uracil thiamine allantoin n=1 Tax=Syntrophaceticus schinkii TaxID=499207 RepID=A0A0B7MFC3_9FIRM|nr:cytosine permease [Syntrophaceticus schinkii]CEO88750.1 Permease for cytosine/purines uracil thiamine allantoin [Syntrophaceticus schinkii]
MSETVYQEKVMEVEPFGVEKIPKEERHGQPKQMFTLWFATNLNVVTWFTGFLGIEFGLSLKYAILAIIIGNVAGAAFLAMTSAMGPSLGQPVIPGSKRIFGKKGVAGLSLFNLMNNTGWLAVNLVLAVMALQKILPLGYHAALIILTLASLLIAIYGYNFIHTFTHWMSIIVGCLFVMVTVVALKNLPAVIAVNGHSAGGFSWGVFILAVAVTFSYQISYTPIGADYSRYLPENTSKFQVWRFTYLGMLAVTIWLEILGALTASLGTQTGPMEFFSTLMGVFMIPALLTIILSIFPINAVAMYSGGLAMQAMGIPIKRWLSAVVIGGTAMLLVSFGYGKLADTYSNFLLLLSYWVAPWLGVVLCDFFYRQLKPELERCSHGWAGILSFICGVVISIPFMNSVLYVGPLAKNMGGADISYFLSMIVSGMIYLGILKMKNADVSVKVPANAEK